MAKVPGAKPNWNLPVRVDIQFIYLTFNFNF